MIEKLPPLEEKLLRMRGILFVLVVVAVGILVAMWQKHVNRDKK
jgi:predicted outer membrane lipoprotein